MEQLQLTQPDYLPHHCRWFTASNHPIVVIVIDTINGSIQHPLNSTFWGELCDKAAQGHFPPGCPHLLVAHYSLHIRSRTYTVIVSSPPAAGDRCRGQCRGGQAARGTMGPVPGHCHSHGAGGGAGRGGAADHCDIVRVHEPDISTRQHIPATPAPTHERCDVFLCCGSLSWSCRCQVSVVRM